MAAARGWVSPSVLPGFGMTLGFAGLFLTFIVLIPLAALIIRASSLPLDEFWRIATEPRALASYRLTFGASLIAASLNAVFGFIIAWTLVRYRFPGRRLVDAIIDLPFALPTAVSGIALATVFAPNGWIGSLLEPFGIQVAYTWTGVVVALTLIGLPFVVRSVQPALEEVDVSLEEAAESLGASRWMVFRRVILPTVLPSLATGFTLALARAIGEYGSVIFIAGNLPLRTEITPLLIVIKLEQYDYLGAAALGLVMLCVSFVMLLTINAINGWRIRRVAGRR
jgi:sulfate transport system permease protein